MIIFVALEIQVEGVDHVTILPCRRHGEGYFILQDLGYTPKTKYKVLRQEFITHDGTFLDRKEALEHIKAVGQCNAT